MELASRHLPWDHCYNARELGGYPTKHGSRLRWGALVRADNLCRLNDNGRAALVAHGVRTVIDLRSPTEVRMEPNPFDVEVVEPGQPRYFHMSLFDEANLEALARIEQIRHTGEMYIIMLEHFPQQITEVIKTVAAADEGGVLVHCFAGKDRTGVIVALLLAVAGVDHETIIEDYAQSDNYLQPLYEQIIARFEGEPERQEMLRRQLGSPAEAMRMMLAHLDEKYDGPLAFLRTYGLTEQEIERLRLRLCD
jgi:protein-tyrosine phosphatase